MEMQIDPEWLKRMAEKEDQCGDVNIGLPPPKPTYEEMAEAIKRVTHSRNDLIIAMDNDVPRPELKKVTDECTAALDALEQIVWRL